VLVFLFARQFEIKNEKLNLNIKHARKMREILSNRDQNAHI